ncbi:MAG TPA: hypothetical protein DIC57_04460 [Sphaerochaeta sp.]|nr:hypothetical protein [Sphaerochaeta sp.]
MAAVIRSLGITGISGYPLMVEVAIIAGLQTTNIIGLGDSAIKEAKDRMEACTEELGYAYPTRKVVVNLSPGDIKKRGAKCADYTSSQCQVSMKPGMTRGRIPSLAYSVKRNRIVSRIDVQSETPANRRIFRLDSGVLFHEGLYTHVGSTRRR